MSNKKRNLTPCTWENSKPSNFLSTFYTNNKEFDLNLSKFTSTWSRFS